MSIVFGIFGMLIGVFIIKYRERIGDSVGEAYWMRHIGGIYNFLIILGVAIFFWSIATMTGTEQIFFAPLFWIFGGALGS